MLIARLDRALQGRPQGAARLLDRQPSRPDHHAVRHRHADRRRGRGVPHPQPRHLQGRAVHVRPASSTTRPAPATSAASAACCWLMPITGTLAMVAAASMAGLPLLNGFLSKEMMLEAAAHTDYLGSPWLVPALATLGALLSVAYSFRFVDRGLPRAAARRLPAAPARSRRPACGCRWRCWWCPVVLIGVAPALVEPAGRRSPPRAVIGGQLPDYHLALWHGFTPALFMTAMAVAGGVAAAGAPTGRARALRLALPRPEAKSIFDAVDRGAGRGRPRAHRRWSTTARCSAACCWRSWSCWRRASPPSWAATMPPATRADARRPTCPRSRSGCSSWRAALRRAALPPPPPAGADPDQRRRPRACR